MVLWWRQRILLTVRVCKLLHFFTQRFHVAPEVHQSRQHQFHVLSQFLLRIHRLVGALGLLCLLCITLCFLFLQAEDVTEESDSEDTERSKNTEKKSYLVADNNLNLFCRRQLFNVFEH